MVIWWLPHLVFTLVKHYVSLTVLVWIKIKRHESVVTVVVLVALRLLQGMSDEPVNSLLLTFAYIRATYVTGTLINLETLTNHSKQLWTVANRCWLCDHEYHGLSTEVNLWIVELTAVESSQNWLRPETAKNRKGYTTCDDSPYFLKLVLRGISENQSQFCP